MIPREGRLLRIFIGESEHHRGRPAHEQILELARREGLAGATVLRGIAGFGRSSRIHTAKILRLSEDLPVVIEIVDAADKIDALLAKLEPLIGGGLITLERAEVVVYRSKPEAGGAT
jgi:PII-like signaling protein